MKFLSTLLVLASIIASYLLGFQAKHDITYTMERTEDGISTIEVYDRSTGTAEYINVKFNK